MITDILGKEIKQIKTENTKMVIDISDLENGIYFISAIGENGRNKGIKKFVVLR